MATTATGRGRLSAEQVARYDEDGYVLFKQPVFSADVFARLKAIFEEDLATYGDEHLDTIHFHDERLLEFLLADELLDLVESVVGPNIGLWSSHFISKAPRNTSFLRRDRFDRLRIALPDSRIAPPRNSMQQIAMAHASATRCVREETDDYFAGRAQVWPWRFSQLWRPPRLRHHQSLRLSRVFQPLSTSRSGRSRAIHSASVACVAANRRVTVA